MKLSSVIRNYFNFVQRYTKPRKKIKNRNGLIPVNRKKIRYIYISNLVVESESK